MRCHIIDFPGALIIESRIFRKLELTEIINHMFYVLTKYLVGKKSIDVQVPLLMIYFSYSPLRNCLILPKLDYGTLDMNSFLQAMQDLEPRLFC